MSQANITEAWRPVVGFVGLYQVSDLGRVRSVDRIDRNGHNRHGIVLRPCNDGRGRYKVVLSKNGRLHRERVYRLVLEAFVGPCPPGMECCHGNGDHTDNRLSNLRWDTRRGNHADRIRHGQPNPSAKLTPESVRAMRESRKAGAKLDELGRAHGVTKSTAGRVVSRRYWRWVADLL